ncbi:MULTISPECIES: hypothetical protein [Actinomyces]|uniref:DUF4352 domain-containing protein n=2 Tax=Actinomyces respiraculi TaxID=2744574 RepID=A0A7T0LN10_9ACTO|nr:MULTISPECIES: hypothetical protein [Actinomyces]QPL06373.1 hypothetical protein ID810_05650 [Actinomyces respiraculi]
MSLRFNPPPNWPAPPEGFVPPAGWQPDPAWGPAPEGWQLWVDDASVPSAPAVPSASDPAWAPTQAVSTSSAPVADPTGRPVSAPSAADYSAPMAASGPDQTSFQPTAAPMGAAVQPSFQPPVTGGSAPMAASAPTSSPYAANMNYAQSPTPYQPGPAPQGFGAQPQTGSWQPLDINQQQGPGSTPVTKKWWFWAIIVVAVLALVGGLVLALTGGKDDDPKPTAAQTSQQDDPAPQPSGNGGSDPASKPTDDARPSATSGSSGGSGNSGNCQQGTSQKCPGDLATQTLTLKASEYSNDPNATVDLAFGDVVWDGTEQVRAGWQHGFVEPGEGKVYMRLPVTVTYHGEGQANLYSLNIKYVHDGNSFTQEFIVPSDELLSQSAPYDGGSVSGYVTFIIPAEYANSGAFAISYNYKDEYWMAEL